MTEPRPLLKDEQGLQVQEGVSGVRYTADQWRGRLGDQVVRPDLPYLMVSVVGFYRDALIPIDGEINTLLVAGDPDKVADFIRAMAHSLAVEIQKNP